MTRFDSPAGALDSAEILKSIGEAAYEWRLDTDALTWSGNAASVFGVADAAVIESGRAYALRVEAEESQSRLDAVTHRGQSDGGAGVAYQVQYAFIRADSGAKT